MSWKRFYAKKKFWFIFSVILLAIILFVFIDSTFLIRSLATVAFLTAFYVGDHLYDINFKTKHYVFFILIVVMGVLASPIYFLSPQYDKIQHLIEPFLISSMVFFMVNRLPLERKWKLWFTFFIVVAMIGLFELGEYTLDRLFDFKLQGVFLRDVSGINKLNVIQEPLDDTMTDMFLGTLGSAIYGAYKGIRLKIRR